MFTGTVYNSGFYHDAVPILIISIKKEHFTAPLPAASDRQVPVILHVAGTEYQARLRWTERMKDIRLCSDLTSHDGSSARLADVLMGQGIGRNMKVTIRVDGNRFEVVQDENR